MTGLYETYVDNLIKVQKLTKPRFDSAVPATELIAQVHENAQELYNLRAANDRLLDEVLFSRKPEELEEQDVADLEEFAARLFAPGNSLDSGVAHYIHRLLLQYAQIKGDRMLYIRELYYAGLTLIYMRPEYLSESNRLFSDRIREYFEEGAGYLKDYWDIRDEETRSYVLRCYSYRKNAIDIKEGISQEGGSHDLSRGFADYMKIYDECMEIYESPEYRAKNPEIPWESLIYELHFDRTRFLDYLRRGYDPVIGSAVLESARYIYDHPEQAVRHGGQGLKVRARFIHESACYHEGLITGKELLDRLLEICESADPTDYSEEGAIRILRVSLLAAAYAKNMDPAESAPYEQRISDARKKSRHYLLHMVKSDTENLLSGLVGEIMEFRIVNDTSFQDHMLDYFLACHPPTYVHSLMVAWIAELLCRQMIRKNPEKLVGVLGCADAEQVRANRNEICRFAYDCGRYHDLGKNKILNYVGLYERKLLDEEFECIKLHPRLGEKLLRAAGYDEIAEVALHHHLWANEEKGYPFPCDECPPHLVKMVGIISAADSIDAATDDIGRSYAHAKSFERLMEELRAGRGTRYDSDVVELLDDPAFYRMMEKELRPNRQEIYCNVYRSAGEDYDEDPAGEEDFT